MQVHFRPAIMPVTMSASISVSVLVLVLVLRSTSVFVSVPVAPFYARFRAYVLILGINLM